MSKILGEGVITLVSEDDPDLDKVIFHYTSIDTLLKIINDKGIWATNIYFKNDVAEIFHAYEILSKVLASKEYYNELSNYHNNNASKIISKAKNYVFIISFSEDYDSHYMWEAYARKNGIALGITIKKVIEVGNKNNCYLQKCIYDDIEKVERIEMIVDNISKKENSLEEKYEEIIDNVNREAAIYKKYEYRLENEWRLISVKKSIIDSNINYTFKNGLIIPYINIVTENSVFSKFVVGPGHEQNEVMESLLYFSANKIKSSILIEKTKSTLRPI